MKIKNIYIWTRIKKKSYFKIIRLDKKGNKEKELYFKILNVINPTIKL